MDYRSLSGEALAQDFGKDIDSLLRIRETAKNDLVRSRLELVQRGAKTVKDGVLSYSPGLNLAEYERCNNQEFAWEVEYDDGSTLKQFDGRKQHHYGHIEQPRLRYFRWVSNFSDETDNQEKRVIVTLDMQTGRFEFLNGFCSQETRSQVDGGFPHDFVPKLVMKMVKRTSTSVDVGSGQAEEITFYNRYLIGWEGTADSPMQGKVVLCVEPNGFVHPWHGA